MSSIKVGLKVWECPGSYTRLGWFGGSVLASRRLRVILWMRFMYREYSSLTSALQGLSVVGDTQPKIARYVWGTGGGDTGKMGRFT